MNRLEELIRAQITATGPITVAEYMALCLAHPELGYYRIRDPFGAAGDFTTAPEISQMFGELIGLWLAQVWIDQGSPAPFALVELGPGRGTLMADALRAVGRVPGFTDAAQLYLVETSPVLREKQAENLNAYDPIWLDQVSELPDAPLFVVANELFDALPIRQFVRFGTVWRERMVGLADGALSFGLSPQVSSDELVNRFEEAEEGALVETCTLAEEIAGVLGKKIKRNGGAVLAIDYGEWQGTGDTLQALKAHEMTDPLTNPGEADLTAHVQFAPLAAAFGLRVQFTTQGEFLERLGITARANALAARGDADAIISQHRRLTHPDEMGKLFKVMGLSPKGAPELPGFS